MPKPQQNRVNIADSRSWKYHISKAAFGRRDIVRSAIPTKLPIPFTPFLSVRFIGLGWWYAFMHLKVTVHLIRPHFGKGHPAPCQGKTGAGWL